MYELKPDDILQKGDVAFYEDGTEWLTVDGLAGDLVESLLELVDCKKVMRSKKNRFPLITYYGTTTVVRWPDGKFTCSRPCKADKKRGIEADKFDPTTGFLHCLAKKHYGSEYKKFIEEANGRKVK